VQHVPGSVTVTAVATSPCIGQHCDCGPRGPLCSPTGGGCPVVAAIAGRASPLNEASAKSDLACTLERCRSIPCLSMVYFMPPDAPAIGTSITSDGEDSSVTPCETLRGSEMGSGGAEEVMLDEAHSMADRRCCSGSGSASSCLGGSGVEPCVCRTAAGVARVLCQEAGSVEEVAAGIAPCSRLRGAAAVTVAGDTEGAELFEHPVSRRLQGQDACHAQSANCSTKYKSSRAIQAHADDVFPAASVWAGDGVGSDHAAFPATTCDGSPPRLLRVNAKRAIMTLPLGVLKCCVGDSGPGAASHRGQGGGGQRGPAVVFHPGLDEVAPAKAAAVRSLGAAVYDKVGYSGPIIGPDWLYRPQACRCFDVAH
jgi:hypothetical protein